MDAQRAHELMEESRQLAEEAAAEAALENEQSSPEEEALLDEQWLMNAMTYIEEAIEVAASKGRACLNVRVCIPNWWMLSDERYSYGVYALSDYEYNDALEIYIPAADYCEDLNDFVPMLDVIAELLEEDGYFINVTTYYGNGRFRRFLSKRAIAKSGLRVVPADPSDSMTTPMLLFYW